MIEFIRIIKGTRLMLLLNIILFVFLEGCQFRVDKLLPIFRSFNSMEQWFSLFAYHLTEINKEKRNLTTFNSFKIMHTLYILIESMQNIFKQSLPYFYSKNSTLIKWMKKMIHICQ